MLIDTNIILEIARDQRFSKDCKDLLNAVNQELLTEEAYITRFSFDAVKAMLGTESPKLLKKIFLMIFHDKLKIIDMGTDEDLLILSALQELKLDFDDATQFVATNKLGTYLVTYDKDFKRTGLEIKTPKEILNEILGNLSFS